MLELKNKFIFPPIKTGYGNTQGLTTEKHILFYKQRAKYLGAITPEPLYLDAGIRELPTQIGIDNDNKIPGLKLLVEAIHSYDTKVIAHLNHAGRMANPKIPGNYFLSSSDTACENGGATPKAMTKDDIKSVIKLFVDAALRAEIAGFDIIELQFGHGYLISQFISPSVNNREDEYGGSFENRIRFGLEVLEAIHEAVKLPVIARISADEMIPNGIKLAEMIELSKILESKGVEAIHVSAGTSCSTPPWFFQHMFVPKGKTWEFANKIREQISIPVIYVGQINEFDDIKKLLNETGDNYIAIGRALVADPNFLGKYFGDIQDIPTPCLACSEGCLGGVRSGNGLGCVVNPSVGFVESLIEKTENIKNVAVVGGGLAGMNAAINLYQRGHKVTIFEKEKLGGQFLLASLPPHKESLQKLVDYLITKIDNFKIEVINKVASTGDLKSFDEIVIASGSKPIIPPIEGLDKYYWAEVLEEHNLPKNKNTLVIGGGLIGTEIAVKLLSKNNKVIIVEMLDSIARGMEMIEQKLTLKTLQNENVSIYLNTKVSKIDGKKIYLLQNEELKFIDDIDFIIMATGMKAYNPFADLTFDKPIHIIGDAKKAGKAKEAMEDSFNVAQNI